MKKILVVGGGAAGMMAAITAAEKHEVILLERNEKLGKKIYITGKGRCNITNVCDREEFFAHILRNPKFLYSSYDAFSNWDMYGSLEEWGLRLKVERGQRVFPESDKSSDVIRTLQRTLEDRGVKVCYQTRVTDLIVEEGVCVGVETTRGSFRADAVILATGGLSYPSTGSDGDGYRLAKSVGHHVTPLTPSLVGINCQEAWCADLAGVSLKNVSIRLELPAVSGSKSRKYDEFGELLFTHRGVSGPLILTLSAHLSGNTQWPVPMSIDLKPALSPEQLDKRLMKELEENRMKSFKKAVSSFLPAKLLTIVLQQAGVDEEKKACDITRAERERFNKALKGLALTLTGLCGYNEAVITKGGVMTTEVNPKTMESKLIKGLFMAGELLDVDALTGGFNLQIAWSTGVAAGKYVGE